MNSIYSFFFFLVFENVVTWTTKCFYFQLESFIKLTGQITFGNISETHILGQNAAINYQGLNVKMGKTLFFLFAILTIEITSESS